MQPATFQGIYENNCSGQKTLYRYFHVTELKNKTNKKNPNIESLKKGKKIQ